ncbi:MAG: hypothetical protein HY084_03550, partial [Gemmatimonadetes bacterium]|nr:hypothetical protein [Gemmatimonadota bacterium]
LLVDGDPVPFVVRADYLVERDGVRSVVEVKTGAVADAGARETRRQILEYAWVYGVSEVHLFNADDRSLQRVSVPPSAHPPEHSWWTRRRIAIVAFAAGVAVALVAAWAVAAAFAR